MTTRRRAAVVAAAKRRSTTTDVKYKYTKFTPGLLDDLDFDALVEKLSDFFLSSGLTEAYVRLNADYTT